MRILFSLILLAGLLSGSHAARAQGSAIFVPLPSDFSSDFVFKQEHLQFTLIRGPKSNTIVAWGGVDQGDAVRFVLALSEAKPVAEIQLFSPGGSLGEGLKIGRIIRERALATHVVAGTMCVSACNFMFMGGVVRTIDPGGTFMVHMFSNNSAQLLLNDLRHPPKSVEEFNDRYPQFKLRTYIVQEQIEKLNQTAKDGIRVGTGAPTPIEPQAPNTQTGGQSGPPVAGQNGNVTVETFIRDHVIPDGVVDMRVKDIQQNSAQIAAVIAEFLLQMRMPMRFLTEFARIPNTAPRALSREELKDLNIIN